MSDSVVNELSVDSSNENKNIEVPMNGVGDGIESGDSSDDFGNFSDASFENEDDLEENTQSDANVNELKELINKNFDKIFDEEIKCEDIANEQATRSHEIQELILSERPSVIYEQLVQLDTVLHPFVWSKSSIKAAVFHILRIELTHDLDSLETDQEPLSDVLFAKILGSLGSELPPTEKVLHDYFKYKYVPRITHRSLQSANELELYEKIPSLINTDVNSLESESAVSSLQEYHDLVCNAIDLLYVKYKVLTKRESDLNRDKAMFENVVSNLTGHTQRLQRNEIANYNKQKKKQHRFSWISR
ncbi:hypothetical protein TPHA_0K01650 [Tetrapisispora phaffii CBS 4417]|uniref:Uncharacterized protein n=1 Tax=Tetrapisispora phaffii (strain ATCC 24235 / CBS 4417 / NBRC 1672 / NRRL Y-8282 / UCD 70-5) TaxID=1071381 RepID=G8BZH0_TETPH|nr:hypothetical protein TPHA_0K01650 [Tetrapisispora phaffii CBS 4417]CCE65298.1 hypothetical protein TPHA_0K01650 [Tetrapisispora phaffii CBS 4417]